MFKDQFIAYLQHQKRCSPHTITAYQKDLDQFNNYLTAESITDNTTIKHTQVRNYLAWLMEQQQSESTVGRKISTLRSYYKFLLRNGHIKKDPMALIRSPKLPKRIPVFIEEQQVNFLLDTSGAFNSSFPSCRDKLVIELLFGTGIRLSELLGLTSNDIDVYQQTIRVLGKRNKERVIPVAPPLVKQIAGYIELKTLQNLNNNTDRLIVNDKGNAAYAKLIYRIVNKYLGIISTQDKKSPHILRHSYATSLLNRGADLNAIKELLGHAGLAATQVYVHNSVERLKAIYKQAHPKA